MPGVAVYCRFWCRVLLLLLQDEVVVLLLMMVVVTPESRMAVVDPIKPSLRFWFFFLRHSTIIVIYCSMCSERMECSAIFDSFLCERPFFVPPLVVLIVGSIGRSISQ